MGERARPMQRILLVGCPRSGTTLLQSMLGTHSDLFTFTESHFFPSYFHARSLMRHRVSESLPDRILAFLDENNFPRSEAPRIRVGNMMRWGAVAQVRKCLTLFDTMAERQGKSAWLEKTPDNLHRLPILESASPNINVVHIIREPSSVIPSLVKASQAWSRPFSLESASEKWLRDVRTSLTYKGKKWHAFVLYEDLVQTPERVVRSLVGGLGLNTDRLRLENYRDVAARVIAPGEWWKENNTRPVVMDGRREGIELPADLAARLGDKHSSVYREMKSICTYPEPSVS